MRQIITATILDQLPRCLGIAFEQIVKRLFNHIPLTAVVAGHAKLVPALAVQGLQTGSFAEGLCRCRMFSKCGISQTHTVPGTIQFWFEAHRLFEGLDGFGGIPHLLTHKAKVKVAVGILRYDAQHFKEPVLGYLEILALRGYGGKMTGRLDILRVNAKGGDIGIVGGLGPAKEMKQPAARIMTPMFVTHRYNSTTNFRK